jgi:hypothetical protein
MLRLPSFRAPRGPALAATACKGRSSQPNPWRQLHARQRYNKGAKCDCVRAGLDYTPLWYNISSETAIPLMCQAAPFRIERRTSAWSA